MSPRHNDVVVIAKRPVAGRVKTRLTPPLTPAQAAELAAAALTDTLDALDQPGRVRTLAFDGDPAGWVRAGWRHVPQVTGDLDARIAAALGAGSAPGVLVGMDTPQVGAELVDAFDPERFDACLGPAADGGFWALGLAEPALAHRVVPGVPMSTGDTGARQLHRLHELGLRVQLLPELTDVDDIRTAGVVANLVPDGRFAAVLGRIIEPADALARSPRPEVG